MPTTDYTQGSVIYREGEALTNISFITKGVVEATFNGQPFKFGQRDMLGISDLGAGAYSTEYVALTDVSVLTHPFRELSDLDSLLRDNADGAQLAVNSMTRQLVEFLKYRESLKKEADAAYTLLTDLYPQYQQLSSRYALSVKNLSGFAEITQTEDADPLEDWVYNYYMQIRDLEPAVAKAFFYGRSGISTGFFHRGTLDIIHVLQSCTYLQGSIKEVSKLLLNTNGHDLFALLSDLHFDSINLRDADATIDALMTRLNELLSSMSNINADYYAIRLNAYKETLATKRASQEIVDVPSNEDSTDGENVVRVKANLSDSLITILAYSECPEEFCNKFSLNIHEYIKCPDRGGSEDVAYRLRRGLTEMFHTLYLAVFMKSLKDPAVPTVIKMFLHFGYVDATLAGAENADYLYSIADSLKGNHDKGVYTLVEWLTAIYKGEKETSKDDFDMDYIAHLREEKARTHMDPKEEARLLADTEAKVRFELENVFPVVN